MAHTLQTAAPLLALQRGHEVASVQDNLNDDGVLDQNTQRESLAVIEELFTAAGDGARWPSVLDRAEALLGSTKCRFFSRGPELTETAPLTSALRTADRVRPQGQSKGESDRLLTTVRSCLEKAMGLSIRLQASEMQSVVCLEALDRLGRGLIIADLNGTAILNNRTAADILSEGDGLALANGRLLASRATESHLLRELIHDAAVRNARGERCQTILPLTRTSHHRMLTLCVASLVTGGASRVGTAGFATVFICDPERTVSVDPSVLCRLYGFTKAEAVLSLRLLDGETIEHAADSLCISIGTARTHLKRILLKTGTNRQVDLINLLLHSIV